MDYPMTREPLCNPDWSRPSPRMMREVVVPALAREPLPESPSEVQQVRRGKPPLVLVAQLALSSPLRLYGLAGSFCKRAPESFVLVLM
jgi:hypothetical protein